VPIHVFVSFDLDHDNDSRSRLVDQVTPEVSRFAVDGWSIREVADDWQDKARKRIANVDLVLVICGEHTDTATNVSNEIDIARDVGVPYFLIDGRPGHSTKPSAALDRDRILEWSTAIWSPMASARRGTVH
jgi:hypothetical protein